jgi:putative ABC transport system substrate-binding protein
MIKKRQNLYILLSVLALIVVIVVGWIVLTSDDEEKEDADSGNKTYTIGIVNVAAIISPAVDGLKEEMAARGYKEGENVVYIDNGVIARDAIEAEIQKMIDQKVDLIVAVTTPPAVKAKEMTAENKIPVVFVPVTDPVTAEIVPDLTHPGANITGIISGQGETRRLEWLTTVDPTIKRIYFPYNPTDASPLKALDELKPAAENLGVELVLLETPDEAAVLDAIENVPDDVDAIFIGPDSLVGAKYADWVTKANELKIPTSGSSQAHVQAGLLCSYSYSPFEAGKLAAGQVDQILKGADPGNLPVETAGPQFSINMVTANAIGLEIPDDVLQQATIIIRE